MTSINLHDWYLCSIELGSGIAAIGFRDPESSDRQRLVAEGVEHLVCDDLREGNTVLSVDIGVEHVTDDLLHRILGNNPYVDQSGQLTKLRDRVQADELKFIRIMPSYGADVVILAKSVSMVDETGK
jgi:hypothetical protein